MITSTAFHFVKLHGTHRLLTTPTHKLQQFCSIAKTKHLTWRRTGLPHSPAPLALPSRDWVAHSLQRRMRLAAISPRGRRARRNDRPDDTRHYIECPRLAGILTHIKSHDQLHIKSFIIANLLSCFAVLVRVAGVNCARIETAFPKYCRSHAETATPPQYVHANRRSTPLPPHGDVHRIHCQLTIYATSTVRSGTRAGVNQDRNSFENVTTGVGARVLGHVLLCKHDMCNLCSSQE